MARREQLFDRAISDADRLFGEPVEPENACQSKPRHDALIEIDREAAKSSIARASSLLQVEVDRHGSLGTIIGLSRQFGRSAKMAR
jgi:hypothetical protein